MDIMVMFHHRDQLNIHRELSAGFFFQDLKWNERLCKKINKYTYISEWHNIQLTISKDVALNRKFRPCYDGENYGEQEYQRLSSIIKESLALSLQSIFTRFYCLFTRRGMAVHPPLYLRDTEEEPDFVRMRQQGEWLTTSWSDLSR